MSELDQNSDGVLSELELRKSPGLMASIPLFDLDGDGALTAAELEGRLEQWRGEKTGLLPYRCEVRWKGKPLSGATVHLHAEPFFNGAIADATGVSDFAGSVDLSCRPEDLPEALKNVRAIRPGVYRIEVTHPAVNLPAKYNTHTTLGQSVSLRNSATLTLELTP
ncbi:MAG: hypothetical protein AAGD11_07355 [Planctomycetota bacterium]